VVAYQEGQRASHLHRDPLRPGVVILGHHRAGQFVVIAHEVGCSRTLVRRHHGLDPFVIPVVNEGSAREYRCR
jgi:hypothetical protein